MKSIYTTFIHIKRQRFSLFLLTQRFGLRLPVFTTDDTSSFEVGETFGEIQNLTPRNPKR